MKPLVFAVDDEQSIRDLYLYTVESAGMNVECFEDGDALFCALKSSRPDLILLDVMLDKMSGFEILKELKSAASYSQIPVIMVSAKGEELNKVKGLDLGADDYVSKPFGVLELIARIKANLRKCRKPSVFKYADIQINDESHKVSINGEETECTLKEYNLLKYLIENANRVLKRDELLNKVWGYDFFGETRTLDMHIAELRKKLSKAGSLAEIETVRGVGYTIK